MLLLVNILEMIFKDDDVFSTQTRLKLVGIAEPARGLWMSGSSAKTRNKEGLAGIARRHSDA